MPLFHSKFELPSLDFSSQTALVTGTTAGLGLAVSKELLRLKISRLIMGVRSVTKGEALKRELLSDATILSPNPDARIDVLELNMEDYTSVVAFTGKVRELTTSIDIVILNAGTGGINFDITTSGHERIIQVNV